MKHAQTNTMGSNFSKEIRFKDAPMYDSGSGSSVFLGPGSYNPMTSYNKLANKPCTAIFVSKTASFIPFQKRIGCLPEKESGEQHYIMVGNQIKFDPAWIMNDSLKRTVKETCAEDAKKSISSRYCRFRQNSMSLGAINQDSIKKIKSKSLSNNEKRTIIKTRR